MMDLLNRLLSKVQFTETCWLWTAYKDRRGYGRIHFGKYGSSPLLAHRAFYKICNGPVPEGLELDHLCRNPSCVNPDHLEAVTHRNNLLRGNTIAAREARQTRCKRGHSFSGRNLYIDPKTRHRYCRTCDRIKHRDRRWA